MTEKHVQQSIDNALNETSGINPDILKVTGFSTKNIRHLFHSLCSYKKEDLTYLEIGLFCGASFCSSFNKNCTSIGIEDHSQDFSAGFETVTRGLKDNVDRFSQLAKEVQIHYTDCFTMDKSVLPKIDILFYDGEHSYNSTQKSLPNFVDNLSDTAIVLYDDACWDTVSSGIESAFKQVEDKLTVIKKWELIGAKRHEDPVWWNGVNIYLINKK